jgi:anhydro-N-acetylmuramic acid kinase
MKEKGDRARRWTIAGFMSGTSLDGIDMAVVETDGVDILSLGPTRYRPYSEAERKVLRAGLGTWPGDDRAEAAARVVEAAHAKLAEGLEEADALGFHGQTLAHDPENRRTHQAGDGARLAKATGRVVIWDFRSTDMEMGGQGAPLAPFYHWACARHIGAAGPVAFLNLGGVGNITLTDPRAVAPEAPGACLAFDTGPANAPMDDLMHVRGLGAFDHEGALAQSGRVSRDVVRAAMGDRFFAKDAAEVPRPERFRRASGRRRRPVGHRCAGDAGRGLRGGGAARDEPSALAARAAARHRAAGGTTGR